MTMDLANNWVIYNITYYYMTTKCGNFFCQNGQIVALHGSGKTQEFLLCFLLQVFTFYNLSHFYWKKPMFLESNMLL
jgi:hypothetical protein